MYMYQMTALLLSMCLFWFGTVYDLRLASYGLDCLQRHFACLVVDFWGFSSHIPGVACIVSHTQTKVTEGIFRQGGGGGGSRHATDFLFFS